MYFSIILSSPTLGKIFNGYFTIDNNDNIIECYDISALNYNTIKIPDNLTGQTLEHLNSLNVNVYHPTNGNQINTENGVFISNIISLHKKYPIGYWRLSSNGSPNGILDLFEPGGESYTNIYNDITIVLSQIPVTIKYIFPPINISKYISLHC